MKHVRRTVIFSVVAFKNLQKVFEQSGREEFYDMVEEGAILYN